MQLRITGFSWVCTSFLFGEYDRERTFMCMAVHMLAKSKMAFNLTAENVNTCFNSGIPANMLEKLILILLMSEAMILYDKTVHVTGKILVMSFK